MAPGPVANNDGVSQKTLNLQHQMHRVHRGAPPRNGPCRVVAMTTIVTARA